MIQAFSLTLYTMEPAFNYIILIFVLYGWSMIPFIFLTSFLFKSYGNAQVGTYFFTFLIGVIIPVLV